MHARARTLRLATVATLALAFAAAPALAQDASALDPAVAAFDGYTQALDQNPASLATGELKGKLGDITNLFKQKRSTLDGLHAVVRATLGQIKGLRDQAKQLKGQLKGKGVDDATRAQLQRQLDTVKSQLGDARNKLQGQIKDATKLRRELATIHQGIERLHHLLNKLQGQLKKGGTPDPELVRQIDQQIAALITALDVPPEEAVGDAMSPTADGT